MTDAYQDSLDIANRALDHLGLPHILAVDEDSIRNSTISAAYDKMREAELRRNIWKFAKRRSILRPISATARLLKPALWQEHETYLPGSVVADDDGALWISWKAENYGNEPGVSDEWDAYFGPLTVDAYASTTTYSAGEIVYAPLAYNGSFGIFYSLQNSNSDNPETATAYSALTTYGLNDRVSYLGSMWRSLITLNLGTTPVEPPADYSDGVTYDAADTATASDGYVYTATTNDTIAVDPVDDDGTFWTRGVPAAWSADPAQYSASPKWLPLFADMTNVPGDWQQVAVGGESVFRLPAGYLRRARFRAHIRQAPDGSEIIDKYITGSGSTMIVEFIANIRMVTTFDAMFCEGLALRIAIGTCKKLTGAIDPNLAALYGKFMTEARAVNAVEMPPEEPDEDEYIIVRESGNGGGFSDATTNWW